jgi:glutathione-regulated potassium-efflux system ancillary protein KefG
VKKVLFIVAHPNLQKSRANKAIVHAVKGLPNLTFHDLYETYPRFFIDVKHEQELLLSHDILVFQHPFYWYSIPPLLKQWEDDVLELGFAYGPGGTRLHGKRFLLSMTAGGPQDAYRPSGYNNFEIDTLITPTKQTANLCGWVWEPHIILHSSIKASQDELTAHAEIVRERIAQCANQHFKSEASI